MGWQDQDPAWTPLEPYADPPAEMLPSSARATLNRLNAMAERLILKYPDLFAGCRRSNTPEEAA